MQLSDDRIPAEPEFYDYDTRLAAYAVIIDGEQVLLSGGSTDYAEWVPIASVLDLPRAGIVDVALGAWLDMSSQAQ